MKALIIVNMAVITCFLTASNIINQNEIEWVGSYRKGLSIAKKEKKFVMLYFHREDFDLCKKFTEGVLSNRSIITKLNRDFVSIDLNYKNPTPTIHQTAKEYNVVNQYPAVAFLDYDGREFESLKMYSVTVNFKNESVNTLLQELSNALGSIAKGIEWEARIDTAITEGSNLIKMVMNVVIAEDDSNSDKISEVVNEGLIWREFYNRFIWTRSYSDTPGDEARVELINPYTGSRDTLKTTSPTNLSNDLRRKFERFQKKYKNDALWHCSECYKTYTDKKHGECSGTNLKEVKSTICRECGCLYPEGQRCHSRAGSIG